MLVPVAVNEKLDVVVEATLNGIGPGSRPVYEGSIRDYLAWAQENGSPTAYSSLHAYRRHMEDRGLQNETINRHLSALRRFFKSCYLMGLIDEATFNQVREVKNIPSQGHKVGNWIGLEKAQQLLRAPDVNTWIGLRDRAILAVLLGAGLRRSEVSNLRFDHLKKINGLWVIENLKGKHNRTRTIPLQAWVSKALSTLVYKTTQVGEDGGSNYLFVSVDRYGNRRERITTQAIWLIVKRYAKQCGIENLSPHDLRRTYAELARDGGAKLEEVQELLGHSSLTTTQRYLKKSLDPVRVSQFIDLEVE